MAYGLAALGFVLWIYAVFRNPECSPALALASVLRLSFLPVYHRVYDTGILTLVLAWIFGAAADNSKRIVPDQRHRLMKRIAFALFLLLLLPIQSVAIRAHVVSFAASGATLVVELSDRAIHIVNAVGLQLGPALCASCFA